MSLEAVQNALGRLYAEPGALDAYLDDPQGWVREAGLGSDEAALLAELDRGEVRRFHRSLIAKRAGAVGKSLPRTRQALGPDFSSLFEEFAGGFLPTGIKRHRQDAVAFADWLDRRLGGDPRTDTARLEASWLRMSEPGRRMSICLHRQGITLWVRLGREVRRFRLAWPRRRPVP